MALVFAGWNFYSLFYTACFTFCSGFVLISSEAGAKINSQLFPPGEQIVYQWSSQVILNAIEANGGKNVGFGMSGTVLVSSLWGNEEERILKLQLEKPSVQGASKTGEPASLGSYENRPFLVVLKEGKLETLFMAKQETNAMKNVKKGLASLFQLRTDQGNIQETDVTGPCNVTYNSSSLTITKTKLSCPFLDTDAFQHLDEILGFQITSSRSTDYNLDDSGSILRSISAKEQHHLHAQAKSELGSSVRAEQTLTYKESRRCDAVRAESADQALEELLSEEEADLEEELILAITETSSRKQKNSFSKDLSSARDVLKADHLGSVKSAEVFLQLLEAARTSSSEDIAKALESKKNAKILSQIYDILGHTQTAKSHAAVMKHLHLDNDKHADLLERYLWALSFSVHPNIDILEDMLKKYKTYTSIPENVGNTLVLSLASMARNLRAEDEVDQYSWKLLKSVEETITNGFDYAKDEDRYVFLNALRNLQSPSTIPKLISVLESGTLKEEVLAWRALKSFGKHFWSDHLLKQAQKTLFQLDKAHDTSSRTLAADLLLAANPSDELLQEMLQFVASKSANFEIKQYVFQSILMLAESCPKWQRRVKGIVKNDKELNNYSSLSPRGLSTALRRSIFRGSSVNGSLVSVQEIKSGIVKRGVVDVVLDKNGLSKQLFTLGIFAGGLSTFMSSTGDEDEEAEEETATAGMELAILGTQIRPFVFFEGQGELMGHVWSGTASELTPAFQALIFTQDHKENLRLGNGFIVDIDLKGAISFDLSGKIEVSIWNRNAQSLIKKSVGYVSKGSLTINTPFAYSQIEFSSSIEPKLNLEIDADFSGNVKLCMKLSQPDSVFRHQLKKVEQMGAINHRLKLALNRSQNIPGVTYALNRKNSEMCNAMVS